MSSDYVIRLCHSTMSGQTSDYLHSDSLLRFCQSCTKSLFDIVAKLHVALHVRVPVYTLHGENHGDLPGCMVFVIVIDAWLGSSCFLVLPCGILCSANMSHPTHLYSCGYDQKPYCMLCGRLVPELFFYLSSGSKRTRTWGKEMKFWEEFLMCDQMDFFGLYNPPFRCNGSDFGNSTMEERFHFGDDFPNLRRSFSEPDMHTGSGVPRERFFQIRPTENLVELPSMNAANREWTIIDLRTETLFYKPACLVQRGALTYLRRYGIRGNTNIKRLKFSDDES